MFSEQAEKWMVATSHPLAVEAALEVMEEGGAAVDAAVAAAAVLAVVDPVSTSIGGDAFAICWAPGMNAPVGLAAAGPAPAGMSMESLRAAGFDTMPEDGPWTITVPGAVAGWERLLERFGTFGLDRALAPAISIAEQGFQVTCTVAEEWMNFRGKLERHPYSASVYLPGGRPPERGQRVANPDLAASLRAIAQQGARVFYDGWIAEAIAEAVTVAGGPCRRSDLSRWPGPRWVSPIASSFRDVQIFELPPPSQGIVALQALKLYEDFEATSVVDEEHVAIESIKLALADGRRFVADPGVHSVPIDELLSERYLSRRRSLIDLSTAGIAKPGLPGDTVYVAVMKEDQACSFIQSIYSGFGSGISVERTGVTLQNRGSGFILEESHPNRPEPGKYPYHTIIPAILGRDGGLWGCLGVVGDFMQPQGHLQVLRNLLDRGADPQASVTASRFRVLGGRSVGFEEGFEGGVVEELRRRGHETTGLPKSRAGGGQVIVRVDTGLAGGSDPRKDGVAKGR